MSSKSRNSKAPKFVPVGKIVGAFGIDGRLKVDPTTSFPERFDKGQTVYILGEPHEILWSGAHKTQFRLRLAGFTTPEQVEAVKWVTVEVLSEDRPILDEDEYYAGDLVGMAVETVDGRVLGEVDDVMEYPAHDIIRVGEILIPAVKEFVHLVDFDNEKIIVELIPGMIEGESQKP